MDAASSPTRLGFALCGSFCTFRPALEQMRLLAQSYEVQPILSEISASTDTRFGKAADFRREIEEICQKPIISTIRDAEPIGPRGLLDILLVEPCTGNTLGKLANGITDSSVTMAVKAHLRNDRPVVLAVSTNDALAASARNLGTLFNVKNFYFVPLRQDSPVQKPTSLVADFTATAETLEAALRGKQLRPLFV